MSTPDTILGRLQEWYFSQCDGDWEHSYGVKIDTLDNPGWVVRIDLIDTALDGFSQERKILERSSTDWVQTEVVENRFVGACGVGNLEELLGLFLEIVGRG